MFDRNSARPILLFALLVLLSRASASFAADEWVRFRGPDGQGHSISPDAPAEFSLAKAIRWRTPIEGIGWSSPVVKDGVIWITTAIAEEASEEERNRKLAGDKLADMKSVAASVKVKAVCVDLQSGKIIHNLLLTTAEDPDPIHPLNTFASPTAAISGNRVVCHFGSYGTWCLDLKSGEEIWNAKLTVNHSVGPGSSPYIVDDRVILVCDGIDQQFVAGLDLETGNEVWRTPRPAMEGDEVEFHKAYSTPIETVVNGAVQVVIPSAQWICAYEPSTGREIWRIRHGTGFSTSPTPVMTKEGLIAFSTGYMRPELVAVKTDGTGDVTDSHIAWRASQGVPTKPSPLVIGDRIYMVSDNGILTQLRADDGSIVWRHRLGGDFSASPMQVGDKIYCCSHDGFVWVVQPGDEYIELAKNKLEPRLLASPAAVDGDLIFRSEGALMCIGD